MITKLLVSTPKKRTYTCDICNLVFYWDEQKSSWYGNFLTPENNIYLCSQKCKEIHKNNII